MIKQNQIIEKILQIFSLIAVIFSVFFIFKTITPPLSMKRSKPCKTEWPYKAEAEQFLIDTKIFLEKLSHPELPYPHTIRNIFIPPIKLSQQNSWTCENCGGKNTPNATICIHCGFIPERPGDTDEDGMPDYWENKYGFDPNDPSDAEKDPDDDLAINVEEFRKGTNPLVSNKKKQETETITIDPGDLPIIVLKTYKKPIKIIFMGYIRMEGNRYSVQVNWGGKTEFYQIGEMVRGWEIKDFQKILNEKYVESTGVPIYLDRSYIICQRKEFTPKKFERSQIVTEDDAFARIKILPSQKEKEVHIDSEIWVKKKKYTVKDIILNTEKIIIEDETKKPYTLQIQN